MTLADLLSAVAARGALPRIPAKKTALKYLANALGYPSLEQCPVGDACRDPEAWAAALDTHFATLTTQGRTLSPESRRNVRNELRVVFRQAEAYGLLTAPLPPVLLAKPQRLGFTRQQLETAPYQETYRPTTGPRRYGLPLAQWPPDIQAGWRDYQAKCDDRLRETTFHTYAETLATYLGFLQNIRGRTPTWDDCFDVAQLSAFVRWHRGRLQRPTTTTLGKRVTAMLAAMARVVEHRHAGKLAHFHQKIQPPAPVHMKRLHHWVSLARLQAVADAYLDEGRAPYIAEAHVQYPGSRRATHFQRGVMLALLVRIPLRLRNVHGLRVDRHLYQGHDGHWWLHFQGGDLKIGTRSGQVNEYKVDLTDYCPELLPLLDEFRREYRSRLPNAATSPFLFLTRNGARFTSKILGVELSDAVAMRTGQRWYPHLIRTTWATEYIEKTRDFTGAAYMLGDNVATVLKAYQDILGKDQHAKAKDFLAEALRAG